MVFFVVKMLNYFPAKGGVSTQFSPKTIMSGQTLTYKQCSLPFGTYCQVHEENGPRNSLVAQTSGAISVGPASNWQGGHLFMSLNTGRIVSRRSWTVIPMPQTVIDKVNSMASNQPKLLTFLDRNGAEIQDDEPIITPPLALYETPGVIGDAAQIPGVDTDVAIEDVAIEEDNSNMELPNDQGINPPPAPEPSNIIEYDMADNTADNTAEPTPEPVITPTSIKPERPSRNRKQ